MADRQTDGQMLRVMPSRTCRVDELYILLLYSQSLRLHDVSATNMASCQHRTTHPSNDSLTHSPSTALYMQPHDVTPAAVAAKRFITTSRLACVNHQQQRVDREHVYVG